MSKVAADHSFEREGRPLRAWLLDTVDRNSIVRRKAFEALDAMRYGLPSFHTDLDDIDGEVMTDAQGEAFRREVETAVTSADYPGADFVRALTAWVTGSHEEWLQVFRAGEARVERVTERIERQIDAAQDERQRESLRRRLRRAVCGDTKQAQRSGDALMESAHFLGLFESIGRGVLVAPDAVRALLNDPSRQHRWVALRAIERAGPDAADEFLADLMPPDRPLESTEVVQTLAAVGHADERVVRRMCDEIETLLADASPAEQMPPTESPDFHGLFYGRRSGWAQAGTLAQMGPAARSAGDDGARVVPLLIRMTRSPQPGQRAAAAGALGSCARGERPEVIKQAVTRLLEMTADHPWVAGRAIDGLGVLREGASRVVPRLVELFDAFEEFDPDMGYHGAHARVCDALAAFGTAAAPAVQRVVRELEREIALPDGEREWPQDLLKVLRAVGLQAAAALPVLERYKARFANYDEEIDALIRAIGGT